MTGSPTPPRVGAGEITDLLARSLSEQGRHADPAERAAYQASKAKLPARITAYRPHTSADGGDV